MVFIVRPLVRRLQQRTRVSLGEACIYPSYSPVRPLLRNYDGSGGLSHKLHIMTPMVELVVLFRIDSGASTRTPSDESTELFTDRCDNVVTVTCQPRALHRT